MHFDFTITLGNLVTIFGIIGGIWRIEMLLRKLDWILVEHEILIRDYCKRMGIEIGELPTRMKKRF